MKNRKKFNSCFFYVFLLLGCLALGVLDTAAEEIPAWLDQASQADPQLGEDAGKRVWLVVGSEGENVLKDVRVMALPAFIESSSKEQGYLYDQRFDFEHHGERFSFGREEIAFIRYYTHVSFQNSGPPTCYSYAPQIQLKNGEILEEAPQRIFPEEALKPGRFSYESVEVTTFHGKSKERRKTAALTRPVLAMAWSRMEAEEAREQILLRYARNEYNRLSIKWGDRVTVYTATGPVVVEPHARYETLNEGGYSSWIEKTTGTITLEIDGRTYDWSFGSTCRDSVNAHTIQGFRGCGPHVRVSRWEKDLSGRFEKFYFGAKAINVFYSTGNNPQNTAEIDSHTINVGFRVGHE